jgi:5,10-methylenetetrahydrofolate reductase
MNFKEKLESNKFVISCEISPPKGIDISFALKEANKLKNLADAINLTDNQRSVMRMNPAALAHYLSKEGIEPILQITCRDRNVLALQSDLLSAYALGIKNILLLTGDYPREGDHPMAKPVFDLDSVQLVALANILTKGKDWVGHNLEGTPDFFIGVAHNPALEPEELYLMKLEKKIIAGARFIQTQAVYDPNLFINFINKLKSFQHGRETKVLAGVFPLKSAKMARFMNQKIPGVFIKENIIEKLEKSKDPVKTGVDFALDIIKEIKPHCHGLHLMTMGSIDTAKEIILKL